MNQEIKKFRGIAILGIIIMGIGSFMSCLATTKFLANIGVVLLCISIIISVVGFSKWQP